MATLSPSRARSHFARQSAIAAAAVVTVRRMFKRNRPLPEIVATVAAYQLAAATASTQAIAAEADDLPLTNPRAFAGVTSHGFPLSEPITAVIDRYAPAPVEALPANWWDDALEFMGDIERLIESEVRDAGRSAGQAEMVPRPDWQNYVRLLTPPSCPRCVVLAGRIYRDLEGFSRHPPTCDCQHWPVQSWEEAHDAGLVSSPQEAFDKGQIRGLSESDTQAIRDGADITKVINAQRGMLTADVFGRRVKATTEGTTRRAAWRRANPSILVRLRPESIYRIADGDRAEVLRLLRVHGYLTS